LEDSGERGNSKDMKESEDIRSLKLTLGLYVLIFAAKVAAYFASGVMALLAEALHTLSDIFIAAFLLIATLYSRRVADKQHMFGYGRAQNIAALVAATLFISFTSFELYKEALPRLFSHEIPEYQNVGWAIAVLILSMVIAAAPLVQLLRQKSRGAAAKAQLLELVNDELGLLAALVGTLFVLGGASIADPLAACVVATIIAINAVKLFRENLSFLMGRAPDAEFMNKLADTARSVPGVLGLNDMRAEYIGQDVVHADVHIEVSATLTVEEGHQIARKVDRLLEPIMGNGICEIHVDPKIVEANPAEVRPE
jgi:cation diffusion facilitator family transporter